ncbi:MAG: capsular polysaccharide biosynthesis protein [Paracoccaceae bacterium]
MTHQGDVPGTAAVRPIPQKLYYFNGGFFAQRQVRRILSLSGFDLRLGKPGPEDLIAVWGKSPTSGRGEAVSTQTGAPVLHVEDAFLRSVATGRDGDPPLGLTLDFRRPYFDSAGPSDLEVLLSEAPLDDNALLTRARNAIDRIRKQHLSKYNQFDPATPPPDPGYVLVIDQTRDDASIRFGGGSVATFREMLVYAQQEHPKARILIKSHPETMAGHRSGHYSEEHLSNNISFLETPLSPQALLEGAVAVYTVSSGFGFEAILAGHKPVVFGQPFYAGWGLSDDRQPIDRRQRKLTRAQLFAGAMILYPKWYDPYRDALCEIEQAMDTLESQSRAFREDKQGFVALGMRAWKRKPLQAFFGARTPLRFAKSVPAALQEETDKPLLVWTGSEQDEALGQIHLRDRKILRVEDGFIRSRGLGADLVPPLSLVCDDLGIYYDPRSPSRLENLISASTNLPDHAVERAARLRRSLVQHGITKYNLQRDKIDLPENGRDRILVVGQIEDDASVLTGASEFRTNEELLKAVRADFSDAFLIYKTHPDAVAGLRSQGTPDLQAADLVLEDGDPADLLDHVDRVCTLTSLLGFEALIREVPVSCYGAPFYAGWGLTDDRATVPLRRKPGPSLDGLLHAALIAYPRYYDPVTALPCPPEIAILRLASGPIPSPGLANRLSAKLQGMFAGYAHLWRR